MPNAQMSTFGPEYESSRNSSGAAYGGDPQNVFSDWSNVATRVLKPKSPTLTARELAKKTFSAFRSRWMMWFLCCRQHTHGQSYTTTEGSVLQTTHTWTELYNSRGKCAADNTHMDRVIQQPREVCCSDRQHTHGQSYTTAEGRICFKIERLTLERTL